MKIRGILATAALLLTVMPVLAEPDSKQADSSGTNPIDFTYDFRIYTELQEFSAGGDNGGGGGGDDADDMGDDE